MRWPDAWADPAALDLVRGSAIDCLLIGDSDEFVGVRERAQRLGLRVVHPDTPPPGVAIVKGGWPGIKMARGRAQADAGPTGEPWVDSNGWTIRRERSLHPDNEVWIDAPPAADAFIAAESYRIAVADCAMHGGRWIVSLDAPLAAALAAGKSEAQRPWKALTETAAFFAARKRWADYNPRGVVGVISDFSGDNEFFSGELLNLLARTGEQYRLLPKQRPCSFENLQAILYADAEPPAAPLRKQMTDFVDAGGLLIANRWARPGGRQLACPVERFSVYAAGKGRIAVANAPIDDPYVLANDSVVLVSHRYDLVRLWNAGAATPFYTASADGSAVVVHLLFYSYRGPDAASVRVAGRFRDVRAATVESPDLAGVHFEAHSDATEIHLPQVSQYIALQLASR
jgi:hypothetical protein